MNYFAIIVLVVLIAIGLYMAAKVEKGVKRRGCGRGCATCGNRFTCHKKGEYK